ncbi:efflux RND transporter periplasmic adaptor subunit [Marinobacter caseinilyticus]|uniref:efflux RND transporter periplasmic adaptor subunit n=1 Tax=Marinobacter caseinilyticus TaxID=2692195 RepID=UPI00140B186B|nr:efflux RND transporter periplasmic adaptor subunit [Marinobacter caseinilyticus]
MAKQWITAIVIVFLAIGGAGAFWYWSTGAGDKPVREKRVSNVNVVQPQMRTVRDVVAAVGTLRARNAVALISEVSGRIVALNFEPGDPVAKDQLLVRLDDRQARADLQVAEAQYADARRQYDRARSLQSNNSISQSQVDALRTALEVADAQRQAARTRLDNHRIHAPFAGVVGLVDISVGAYITLGESITTLDAVDPMELTFSVPERYLGQISQGQTLTARTAAFPDLAFQGTLAELGTRIDSLSRALPVKALIDNREGKLRPGQFISVNLTLRQRQALVIPEQAVLVRGTKAFVFVAVDGEARRMEVSLGVREPGQVEVRTGVALDDAVVITGQDRLSSGDRVAIVDDADALISSGAPTAQGW